MKKSLVLTIILALLIVPIFSVEAGPFVPPTDINPIKAAGGWVLEGIATVAGSVLLKLSSLLTQLSGMALNSVTHYTIVNVADNYRNLPAIQETWGTVRDIANMGFIFVLLYAAIQTVLGRGGDNQKTIVNVVIAAILINFSLFFTQVIIDVSNLLAVTFYSAIAGPEALSGPFSIKDAGLSNAYTNLLNFQSLWDVKGEISTATITTVGIMGSITLLIAAFMFFAMTIMLIIRYAVLILVMILSPIAFVAGIMPALAKYRTDWWKALSGQAFFAPIFLFLTWVAVQVLGGVKLSLMPEKKSWSEVYSATGNCVSSSGGVIPCYDAGAINLLVLFGVTIVFMVASITIAKDWADKTGNGIGSATKWAFGTAGAASFGMAGRFGRGTIGRTGAVIGSSKTLRDAEARGGMGGAMARLAMKAGQKTATGSFDLRGRMPGVDAGKPQKGGFYSDVKSKVKSQDEYTDRQKSNAERATQNAEDRAKNDLNRANTGVKEKDFEKEFIKSNNKLMEIERRIETAVRAGNITEQKELEAQRETINTYKKAHAANKIFKDTNKERLESRARQLEDAKTMGMRFDFFGRVGVIGPVKQEQLERAAAIRKKARGKTAKDQLAEAAKKLTEEDEEGATGAGAGGTPPAGGPPGAPPTV